MKPEFMAWPKIPRLENEVYVVTEKIDGTNACIVISDCGQIYAQSRSRFITPTDDNYGFAKWVYENADKLINDLGQGHHFGEWWGQGIQRGYGLTEKRFSLFNPNKRSGVCHNVPLISAGSSLSCVDIALEHLKEFGSLAAPGYMRTEGVVVYAEKAKTYWKVITDK